MGTLAEKQEVTSRSTAAALLLLLDGLDRKNGRRLTRRLFERVIADERRGIPGKGDTALTTLSGPKP